MPEGSVVIVDVSTHSRPKAAGFVKTKRFISSLRFNTQPPEGGWDALCFHPVRSKRFQHTAARRRLGSRSANRPSCRRVQHTAARRRLGISTKNPTSSAMFQHTAARRRLGSPNTDTHRPSRFNTQPPEGGWHARNRADLRRHKFQHTAARRRLERFDNRPARPLLVSTHSRPKAAGRCLCFFCRRRPRFNTQPPEGGWRAILVPSSASIVFQHTAARRRLVTSRYMAR